MIDFKQSNRTSRHRSLFLLVVSLIPVFLGILVWNRIPVRDSPDYFDFADHRHIAGIPYFGDVVSNLVFVVVGLVGLGIHPATAEARNYLRSICYALILTGIGSAWFHWNPNPQTLFWDRLPLVFIFSGVVGLVAFERLGKVPASIASWFVFLAGSANLILWRFGEADLRFYFLLQAGAFLWLICVNLLFSDGRLPRSRLWTMLGLYAVAKFFEAYDGRTYEITRIISGHTIKHLIAAVAVYVLLSAYRAPERPADQQ